MTVFLAAPAMATVGDAVARVALEAPAGRDQLFNVQKKLELSTTSASRGVSSNSCKPGVAPGSQIGKQRPDQAAVLDIVRIYMWP